MEKKEKENIYASLKKINANILMVKFNHLHPREHEFDHYLDELKSYYISFEETFIVIFDSRKVQYLPAHLRQKQAHWIKENRDLIKEKLILTIYVINNPIVRLILEAIFLIQKSPVPFQIVKNLEKTKKLALGYF